VEDEVVVSLFEPGRGSGGVGLEEEIGDCKDIISSPLVKNTNKNPYFHYSNYLVYLRFNYLM
jgi:hypothetical protein